MLEVFNSRDKFYKSPLSPVQTGESIHLRINISADYCCSGAWLVVWRDGYRPTYLAMAHEQRRDGYDCYGVDFAAEDAGLYWYHFEFDGSWQRKYVMSDSFGHGVVGGGSEFQLTVCERGFETPQWVRGGVIYQIFPDRFCASGAPKSGVPSDRYVCTDWSAQPAYLQNSDCRRLCNDYYGGDLKGIRQKLPYLESLGVTIIYLNPIFEAHSNHRYNTADYFKIDPSLGTEQDFVDLCRAAKKRGMAVILDGVFSHTGDDSIYFDRYGRYGGAGAYNSEQSPYRNWFKFNRWPDDYESWWGVPSLPEVNESLPAFKQFICGENGVLRHWMRLGASGWRLDVADELPDDFLDEVRAAIKAENPDALLIGEVWEDASNKISGGGRRRFLTGRQLDSVMNYPFRNSIIDFVTGGNAYDFVNEVEQVVHNYPRQVLDVLMNHIGTHDTERILSVLSGAPTNLTRAEQAEFKLDDEQLELGRKLLKLAAVLQYTLPGVPSLYYGDEAGVTGLRDPFNRTTYPWGGEDRELLRLYRALGRLRRDNACFAGGDFVPLFSHLGHLAFVRKLGDSEVLVAVNRWREKDCIDLDSEWNNARAFAGRKPKDGRLTLDGYGYAILIK